MFSIIPVPPFAFVVSETSALPISNSVFFQCGFNGFVIVGEQTVSFLTILILQSYVSSSSCFLSYHSHSTYILMSLPHPVSCHIILILHTFLCLFLGLFLVISFSFYIYSYVSSSACFLSYLSHSTYILMSLPRPVSCHIFLILHTFLCLFLGLFLVISFSFYIHSYVSSSSCFLSYHSHSTYILMSLPRPVSCHIFLILHTFLCLFLGLFLVISFSFYIHSYVSSSACFLSHNALTTFLCLFLGLFLVT